MDTASTTTINLGAIDITFLVEAHESHGAATVFECRVPVGANVPVAHSHDGFEETVYGLEGVTTFTIDGHTRDLGPGEAVCIRRGHVHQFVNHGANRRRPYGRPGRKPSRYPPIERQTCRRL